VVEHHGRLAGRSEAGQVIELDAEDAAARMRRPTPEPVPAA
jgi:hypothetical protein